MLTFANISTFCIESKADFGRFQRGSEQMWCWKWSGPIACGIGE